MKKGALTNSLIAVIVIIAVVIILISSLLFARSTGALPASRNIPGNTSQNSSRVQNSSGTKGAASVLINEIDIQLYINNTFKHIDSEYANVALNKGQTFDLNGTIYYNYTQTCSVRPEFLSPFILISASPAMPITISGSADTTFNIPVQFKIMAPSSNYTGPLIENLYFDC